MELLLLRVHHPGLAVPHERLMMLDVIHGVVELPAAAAEVTEARSLPAEVRALAESTIRAQSVLQIGINLDLKKQTSEWVGRCD